MWKTMAISADRANQVPDRAFAGRDTGACCARLISSHLDSDQPRISKKKIYHCFCRDDRMVSILVHFTQGETR